MAVDVILVEAQPRGAADGAPVTVRLAGGGTFKPYRYGGHGWRAGIAGLPTIVASIDFKNDDLGGGGVTQAMVLRWAAPDVAALAEMAAHHWIDAPITVRVGPEGSAELPPVLLSGKVLKATAQGSVLEIALAEPVADLKKPVLTTRFAGTGGIEGPVEWEDRIKPRAWGRVFNLRGEAIDTANNIYCFGDPARPWEAISTVRDKGAAAAQLDQLGWQGSIAATFAALQEADAPQGGGIACPSIACVKWWTQPAGALCADIRGEVGTGYVETAPQIVERIAATVANIPFAAGTVAAAAALRPIPIGCFVGDDSTTAAELLDRLLGDVSLMWLLGDSEITIRPWAWGTSVASAISHEVSRRSTFKPVAKRKLGYRRNQHVMTRDAIAGIVLATDVVFEDGETVEDLQPAAPGATPGAPDGWIIGGTLDPQTGEVEGGLPAEEVLADAEQTQLEQLTAIVDHELTRIRDRALNYGEDGADVRTRFRREMNARLALAAIVTLVQAQLGSVNASVEQLFEAFTDGEEGRARFLLRAQVDVDGNPTSIVGLEGLAGTSGSMLKFMADVIQFIDPDTGDPMLEFDAESGKLKTTKIVVDEVEANSIKAPMLDDGAVQRTAFGLLTSDLVLSGGSMTADVFDVAVTKVDEESILEVQSFLSAQSTDDLQFRVWLRLYVNGVGSGITVFRSAEVNLIFDNTSSAAKMPITPFAYFADVPAGSHVLRITVQNLETGETLTIKEGSAVKVAELRQGAL